MTIQVRELAEGDRDGLRGLIKDVYREMPEAMNFRSSPTEEEISHLIDRKLEGLRMDALTDFVTLEDGRVVADCEAVLDGEGGAVLGLIVDKGRRRMGLGRLLVERCEGRLRELGARYVRVQVMRSNGAAIALFSNLGFAEVKEGAEEDKLLMRKGIGGD